MIQIHHVGYLVKRLEKAEKHFHALGFTPVSRARAVSLSLSLSLSRRAAR